MSQSPQNPQPQQPAWKAYFNPKVGGILAAVLIVGGLAFFGLNANNQPTEPEEMSDEEMLVGFQKQSLGAMGVSDSASPSTDNSNPPPLEFPAADQAAPVESAATAGPLFGSGLNGFDPSPSAPVAVTAASFERPLPGVSTAPGARPTPITPRAVANQPVWLTGTIETAADK